jgi:hypothetical protein
MNDAQFLRGLQNGERAALERLLDEFGRAFNRSRAAIR